MPLNLEKDLEDLTEALQALNEERKRGNRQPIVLPNSMPLNDLKLFPEIEKFIERNRAYKEITKSVHVGEY
jgi:hypothetical protein